MRGIILYSLVSLACLALAGCASDGREEREPANALLLEGLMSGAMADCGNRLAAGEFTTHVERARCEGVEARGSVEGLGMDYAFGDLVALLSEWRLRLARERDAGTLDATGERARQKQFDDAFLREMDVRERLHNSGVRAIEFNICEIEGNGLSCTQTDMKRIEKVLDIVLADCDRQRESGYRKTTEPVYRCVFEEEYQIYDRNNFPHMDLARLSADYFVGLANRWDKGRLTVLEFDQNKDGMLDQYHREINHRNNLRAAGDLNWRRRDCRITGDLLVCDDFEKPR